MLINYWEPNTEPFNLDGKSLKIEVDNIYFITGLSCWDEVVNLISHGFNGGMTINKKISAYFIPNTSKVVSQVHILEI